MKSWALPIRVVGKALASRPARLAAILASLTVGATLASSFLSLYFVLPSKLSGEFKSIGPNIVISSKGNSSTFSGDFYGRLAEQDPSIVAVPWLYVVEKSGTDNLVLAGTEFAKLAATNPAWRVSLDGETASKSSINDLATSKRDQIESGHWLIAGDKAATAFGWKQGQDVEISYADQKISLPLLAIVSSGESEDSQVILPLDVLQKLTAQTVNLSVIQVRVSGSAQEIESHRQKIASLLPEMDVRPLLQVVESETRVVMKVRALMYGLTAVVLCIVILSVMTTFSGVVLDRQKEIGIMKTLGASESMIGLLFIAETTVAALLSASVGHLAGYGLASWAARGMFHSSLPWSWSVMSSVVAVTLLVALIATAVPIRAVRKLEPAIILKGS